ncbi:MAG: selenium metabolism-associated LysR family transcriptional regulator [Dissulfurispiraceae bacterium]|jgi:DNA-binding transcriptional LysR family regulator|nr:selenium metabolism-associated LysR family transcriptional regulator [Dissulfurispiraceae bacterium]
MIYDKLSAMDIHHLKVFVSVYKNRSFSKASEYLFLCQPTVSDHIKTLEKELECRLFDRLGRSIRPTAEADILFERAVEIIEKTDELKLAISNSSANISGTISFGSSTIPGSYIMPQIMAAFKHKHPEVDFIMISSDTKEIIEKVASHELAFGICGSMIENNQIAYKSFFEDELIAVAAPSMRLPQKLTIKQLSQQPFVIREHGSGTRREIERIFEKHGVDLSKIRISATVGSTNSLKQAVKAGLGMGIVSRIAVSDEIRDRSLYVIQPDSITMKRKFYIATHKKRTLPLLHREFIKLILKPSA